MVVRRTKRAAGVAHASLRARLRGPDRFARRRRSQLGSDLRPRSRNRRAQRAKRERPGEKRDDAPATNRFDSLRNEPCGLGSQDRSLACSRCRRAGTGQCHHRQGRESHPCHCGACQRPVAIYAIRGLPDDGDGPRRDVRRGQFDRAAPPTGIWCSTARPLQRSGTRATFGRLLGMRSKGASCQNEPYPTSPLSGQMARASSSLVVSIETPNISSI